MGNPQEIERVILFIWKVYKNEIYLFVKNFHHIKKLPVIDTNNPMIKNNNDINLLIPVGNFIKDAGFSEFGPDGSDFVFEGINFNKHSILFSYNATNKSDPYGFQEYYFTKIDEFIKYEIRCPILHRVFNHTVEMQRIYAKYAI
jgi:hypothetical protein